MDDFSGMRLSVILYFKHLKTFRKSKMNKNKTFELNNESIAKEQIFFMFL